MQQMYSMYAKEIYEILVDMRVEIAVIRQELRQIKGEINARKSC